VRLGSLTSKRIWFRSTLGNGEVVSSTALANLTLDPVLKAAGRAARLSWALSVIPWVDGLMKESIPDDEERMAFANSVKADLENDSYRLYFHL
jgi:hypothetical protein